MIEHQREVYLGPFKSSRKEMIDLLKAWAAISFAFAVLSNNSSIFPLTMLPVWFLFSGLTVGIGFLLHELGHKAVAQKYGCIAEFRSFDQMLLISIAMSFFGFILAAPGAVMIRGRVTPAQNGRISAAGAVMNIALAVFFLANLLIFPMSSAEPISMYNFLKTGLFINALLALFNMIPIFGFDGGKILAWNKAVYAGLLILGIALMVANALV